MHATLDKFLPLILLGALCCQAQDAGLDEVARAAEIDALQPGVSLQALDAEQDAFAEQDSAGESAAAGTSESLRVAQEIRRRPTTNGVMDELDLERTEITGNQELPKVLYIVPWQRSDPGDLTGKPINTLLDEVLAPIDRTEFMRQVEYYDDLYRADDS